MALTREAVRYFRSLGGGVLIAMSSWAAQRGSANPDLAAYSASKAAPTWVVFLATGTRRHLSGATFDVSGATYIR